MSAVHREAFRVRAGEVGPGGPMRLPALLDLFQEAAGNSAAALGWGSERLLAEGKAWVLSRFHLRLAALPSWREEVTVETWPSGVHRVFALREFRALGPSDALLAEATSAWLLLSTSARRPLRLPPEIAAIAEGMPPRTLADAFDELPGPGLDAEPRAAARVGRFDLDLVGHANNVAILRALLEALPPQAPPFELEAEFKGESFEGDFLEGRVEEAGGARRVALHRVADGREIARAVLTAPR